MKYLWLSILLIVCIILQVTSTVLPLLLIPLLLFYLYERDERVFVAAFMCGIVLDTLLVQPVGLTSIFLLCFLCLVFLYQRKFEIGSPVFVGLALFSGSFLYALIFGRDSALLIGLGMGILGEIVFMVIKYPLLRRIR